MTDQPTQDAIVSQRVRETEAIAVIGNDWRLLWASQDALSAIVDRTGLKIGDKLYRHLPSARAVGGDGLSGFDPSRLREIPVWMVRDMCPGWQDQGTSAYHGADAIDRLESALATALEALRKVGGDCPDSSCEQWCNQKAAHAEAIAKGKANE